MNYDSPTPTSLLVQCRENIQGSWDTLNQLYGRLVWHWCSSVGLSDADCDEIYQEVFLSVVRHIHTFRKEKPEQKFRCWLRSITRSRIADFHKKKQQTPVAIGELENHIQNEISFPDDEEQETTLLYHQLMKILQKDFTERDILVFKRLATAEGITSEAIGEEFGLTASAVRQIKYRIKKRIQEEFSDLL
ncbi:MAG: sigma-70 family RNA polymerase sigma factor [Thermoguttaceae bacterium]|nr:sigma-70 family RNA polymerase sigma factor [Planctomycetaceae bacterium]MBQ4144965.1 sigma-70 family RNA polymerase sigma factor [Thermoguttaceae bacterium]